MRKFFGGKKFNEYIQYFDSGYLGKNTVIVMMDDTSNIRIPSGNELGAWPDYWEPRGYTSDGIKEAVIDPVPEGKYIYIYVE